METGLQIVALDEVYQGAALDQLKSVRHEIDLILAGKTAYTVVSSGSRLYGTAKNDSVILEIPLNKWDYNSRITIEVSHRVN